MSSRGSSPGPIVRHIEFVENPEKYRSVAPVEDWVPGLNPGMTAAHAATTRRPLTEDDAVDIWIARWLRVRPKDLVHRYQCDPRRLYEIWEETRFPGARTKALALLRERYPYLENRFDPGAHRRISNQPDPRQLHLFPASQIAR
jgi:hypothetical protein